jgi:hypothetical protein
MLAEGGVAALYKGLYPTLLACAPFLAVQQAVYDVTKNILISSGVVQPSAPLFIACGAFAGAAAQACIFPLDVVRRRMQLAPTAEGVVDGRLGTLGAMRVVAAGGIARLFAGISPTMMKVLYMHHAVCICTMQSVHAPCSLYMHHAVCTCTMQSVHAPCSRHTTALTACVH